MADTLEPIVIPPLKVEKHFTCSGSGLRYEDQERVPPETLRSLLLPSGGRNGISDRDRAKTWWGAQALFYGFKYTKSMTITQVRAQIEDALRDKNKGLRVPQDILDLEYKYNKEFRELNAQVRDKAGLGGKGKRKREDDAAPPKASKSKSKAEATSPAKKPRTKSPPPPTDAPKSRPKQTARKTTGGSKDVVASNVPKPRIKKQTVPPPAENPFYQMLVDPKPEVPAKQTAKRAAAPTADTFDFKMDVDIKPSTDTAKSRPKQTARKTTKGAVDDDAMDVDVVKPDVAKARTKQTARKTTGGGAPKAGPSSLPAAAAPRTKQSAKRGGASQSTAPRTDIVSGTWALDCPAISNGWDFIDPSSLTLNVIGRGNALEGEFDLGLVQGLLRSTRVEERGPDGAYATVHWAGEEHEGPICTPRADRSGYIKFTGDRLKGKLNYVNGVGDVEFEGRWVGGARLISARWEDYSEEAYEHANRARWH
ncbi:hypothetical protein FB45DRAFT_940676 [Roridomyces roridus]|uniref:Uncharacterized protein n=1 Tax=Roridomyces roridus TaxID=1738132 RepID=A0AAD7B6V9_9AGAR|nr:hypothetical protein FB45DRAFT_940676 [Roridomyces roridus]